MNICNINFEVNDIISENTFNEIISNIVISPSYTNQEFLPYPVHIVNLVNMCIEYLIHFELNYLKSKYLPLTDLKYINIFMRQMYKIFYSDLVNRLFLLLNLFNFVKLKLNYCGTKRFLMKLSLNIRNAIIEQNRFWFNFNVNNKSFDIVTKFIEYQNSFYLEKHMENLASTCKKNSDYELGLYAAIASCKIYENDLNESIHIFEKLV